jgi:hypothetical protein
MYLKKLDKKIEIKTKIQIKKGKLLTGQLFQEQLGLVFSLPLPRAAAKYTRTSSRVGKKLIKKIN